MMQTIKPRAGDMVVSKIPHIPGDTDRAESGQGRPLSDKMALQRIDTQFDMQFPKFSDKTVRNSRGQGLSHRGGEGKSRGCAEDLALRLERWDLEYLPDPGLLICRLCGLALWGNKTLTHLKDDHRHHILGLEFDDVVQKLPLYCHNAKDVPHRQGDLPAVPYLKILNGYRCTLCAYASVSQRLVTEHVQENHPDRPLRPQRLPYIAEAKVQNYYPWQNMRSYFTVTA